MIPMPGLAPSISITLRLGRVGETSEMPDDKVILNGLMFPVYHLKSHGPAQMRVAVRNVIGLPLAVVCSGCSAATGHMVATGHTVTE